MPVIHSRAECKYFTTESFSEIISVKLGKSYEEFLEQF